MSDTLTDDHHDWIASTFGVDPRSYGSDGDSSSGSAASSSSASSDSGSSGGFWDKVSSAVGSAVDSAESAVGSAVDSAESAVGSAASAVSDAASSVADSVADVASSAADTVSDAASSVGDAISSTGVVGKAVVDTVKSDIDFTKGVAEGVYEGGKGIVVGVAKGVAAVAKEGYALATDAQAREDALNTVEHAAQAVGDFEVEMVTDPSKALGEVEDSVSKGIDTAGKIATHVYNSYEEAAAAGHGSEFLGKAVGQGAVLVGGALIPGVGEAEAGVVAAEGAVMVGEAAATVGEGAALLGEGAAAVGEGSALLGEGAAAVGEGSAVLGEGAAAAGEGSAALGEGAEALGEGTEALGDGANAASEVIRPPPPDAMPPEYEPAIPKLDPMPNAPIAPEPGAMPVEPFDPTIPPPAPEPVPIPEPGPIDPALAPTVPAPPPTPAGATAAAEEAGTAVTEGAEGATEGAETAAEEGETAAEGGDADPFADLSDAEIDQSVEQMSTDGDLIELGPHRAASANREALGVSGQDVQSAHDMPQAIGRTNVPDYNPNDALTRLMERADHAQMDQGWKDAFQAMRRAGRSNATAQEVFDTIAQSIRNAPGLPPGERESMVARLVDEMFTESGFQPGDVLDLPYPNIKPAP